MSIKDLLADINHQPVILKNHLENIERVIETTQSLFPLLNNKHLIFVRTFFS